MIEDGPAVVTYHPEFLEIDESTQLFDELSSSTKWSIDKHNVKGDFDTPRRVGCFTTVKGLTYEFSGNHRIPQFVDESVPTLKLVWDKIEKTLDEKFNFVLINKYENGKHSLGWHSDKATNLVVGSSIVSISLGQERWFEMKPRKNNKTAVKQVLGNGSMLVMNYETQEHYLHRVPKMKLPGDSKPRINLTFRHLKDYDIID
jgi:alkylated DNA repair dioxygenase AlkB